MFITFTNNSCHLACYFFITFTNNSCNLACHFFITLTNSWNLCVHCAFTTLTNQRKVYFSKGLTPPPPYGNIIILHRTNKTFLRIEFFSIEHAIISSEEFVVIFFKAGFFIVFPQFLTTSKGGKSVYFLHSKHSDSYP